MFGVNISFGFSTGIIFPEERDKRGKYRCGDYSGLCLVFFVMAYMYMNMFVCEIG